MLVKPPSGVAVSIRRSRPPPERPGKAHEEGPNDHPRNRPRHHLLPLFERDPSHSRRHVGHLVHTDDPLPASADHPFRMRFHLTEAGLLRIRAREPESGHEADFGIRIGGMSPEQVEEARQTPGMIRAGG